MELTKNNINEIGEKIFEAKLLAQVIYDLIDYSIDCGSDDCVHMVRIAEIMLEDMKKLHENFEIFEIELMSMQTSP